MTRCLALPGCSSPATTKGQGRGEGPGERVRGAEEDAPSHRSLEPCPARQRPLLQCGPEPPAPRLTLVLGGEPRRLEPGNWAQGSDQGLCPWTKRAECGKQVPERSGLNRGLEARRSEQGVVWGISVLGKESQCKGPGVQVWHRGHRKKTVKQESGRTGDEGGGDGRLCGSSCHREGSSFHSEGGGRRADQLLTGSLGLGARDTGRRPGGREGGICKGAGELCQGWTRVGTVKCREGTGFWKSPWMSVGKVLLGTYCAQ